MSVWILQGGFDRNIKSHYGKEIIYDPGGYANQAVKTLSGIFGTFILYTCGEMFKSGISL